ncbi:MAG: MMPL family transporter, partial [Myxococcales bacterium]|nr:MMPL family transporter [Myxococcales bacterium]
MAVLSAGLTSQIFSLTVDNSMEAFLHTDDPIRIAYDEFRTDWGRDEQIMLAIETTDVFASEFLERLRAFHEELEQGVPHLDDITSMVNARSTRGEGDTLIVKDLLEDWPDTPEKLATLRERVLSNPIYRNSLVTTDATVTTVFIRLVVFDGGDDDDSLEAGFEDDALLGGTPPPPQYLPEPEISRAVDFVREVIERYESDDFRILLAGAPVMSQVLNRQMQSDMGKFTLYSLGAIAVLLFMLYRRIAAVLLPMLVVILSMLSTLGVMSLSGTSIGVGTQILPSFLLCVGVCDAVHLLAIYYQRLKAGDASEQAISFTLGPSGLAIVLTSLTTMGGLGP